MKAVTFQMENNTRQEKKSSTSDKICLKKKKGKKHGLKRRKLCFISIFSISFHVFKDLFFSIIKSQDCVVNGAAVFGLYSVVYYADPSLIIPFKSLSGKIS